MIKTLAICAKTNDQCGVTALDENDNVVMKRVDYVPDFMPGEHFGDYVELVIDVKTGQVLNWTFPTQAQIKRDLKKGR